MKIPKISHGIMLANLLVIALAAASFMSLYSIQPMYPLNGMLTDERMPTFAWTGQMTGYELLIDDEPGFDSPMTYDVSGNSFALRRELPFGTYWWKVRSGDYESRPMRFELVSTVALSRMGPGAVRNTGNTGLIVHRSGITGAATLAVNQTLEIGVEENVKAEQK